MKCYSVVRTSGPLPTSDLISRSRTQPRVVCKARGSQPGGKGNFSARGKERTESVKKERSSTEVPAVQSDITDVSVEATPARSPALTIAVVGKDGAGKTRLVAELLRLQSDKNGKQGGLSSLFLGQPSADELTSEEDSEHFNTTVYNHVYCVDCASHRLQIVDCPGLVERLPHVDMALRISSGAIFVVNMASGVDEAAERVWERISKGGKPSAVFISQVDLGEMKDFEKAVNSLREQFSVQPVILHYPYYNQQGELVGLIDVLNNTMCIGEQGCMKSDAIPSEVQESVALWLQDIVTVLAEAEVDEELMEAYLDEATPSAEVLHRAVKKAVQQGSVVPVLCGSSAKGMGADALDEFLVSHFPAVDEDAIQPAQWVASTTNGQETVMPDPYEPFVGYVFGTHWDKYAGKCCDVLVLRGTVTAGQKLIEGSTLEKVTTQKVMRWSRVGELEAVEEGVAYPGDLIVLDHCDGLQVNQTLCDPNSPLSVEPVHFEKPRCTFKLDLGDGTTPTEDEKVLSAIHKVMEEDPSIRLVRNDETSEFLLSGMGLVHLEIVKEKLRRQFGVELKLSTPHVAYHEAPTKKVKGFGRHKKQSGGHGQFGVAEIWLEPLPRGSGVQFVSEIKGGVIPKQLYGSVERGVRHALTQGPLGKFPVVDVKVTLFDGKTHSVDSGDAAFFQAGVLATRDALSKSKPALLEPVMMAKIDVPEKEMGSVTKDIARRRGQVMSMNTTGHMSVVEAMCPLATMLTYSADLQQITAGLGMFTMQLQGYQEVPGNLVEGILKETAN